MKEAVHGSAARRYAARCELRKPYTLLPPPAALDSGSVASRYSCPATLSRAAYRPVREVRHVLCLKSLDQMMHCQVIREVAKGAAELTGEFVVGGKAPLDLDALLTLAGMFGDISPQNAGMCRAAQVAVQIGKIHALIFTTCGHGEQTRALRSAWIALAT